MILYRREGNNLTIKLKFTQKQLKGQKKKWQHLKMETLRKSMMIRKKESETQTKWLILIHLFHITKPLIN